jgi:ubiquinone/menaquinone biosynthesis C-methylase UbiE
VTTPPKQPLYDFEAREREDENAASGEYDRLYHGFPIHEYWDEDYVAFVATEWSEGDRVLDLGCGPASLWPYWQHMPATSRLVGVDISPGMIEQASRKHPEAEFSVGRAHELPFEDGSFDVVVASAVLHHIPDEHLPAALDEIVRVLDEHGRVVGREPKHGGIAATPGWLSGSVMSFRHLVYRLTHSREFPEPQLGDHHHVLDPATFLPMVEARLKLTRFEERFAFSNYVSRVRDPRIASFAASLDGRLESRDGTVFYYCAHKNYYTAADVASAAELARRQETEGSMTDEEFLAYLQAAASEIERMFRP